MLRKALTTVALTATAVGAAAAPAVAIDDDTPGANANGARTVHGGTVTGGERSPQMSAIQSTAEKLCVGVGGAGIQSLLLLINIGIQDVPVLTSQQQQQCADNSEINDGDDPLSHLIEQIPVISGNGSGNRG
ncbi:MULTISPECIES: rodlin [Streptomyces]|uniref:rodlin n=1 Tax=Streptomyces TaxID=1883 RepID=UPI0031D98262